MSDRTDKKLMPCSQCSTKFSEDDVGAGLFFVSTMTCKDCYVGLQRQPHYVSCFGKPSVRKGAKEQHIVAFGYDKTTVECSQECPDRHICRAFVKTSVRDGPSE